MKKILALPIVFAGALVCSNALAGYDNDAFTREAREGLDIHIARTTVDVADDAPIGEMGMEVYQTAGNKSRSGDYAMFIPTTMYIRGGAGMNLGFASSDAKNGDDSVSISNGWLTQMGLGWNMSSYVRTEVDFQVHEFGFADYDAATSRQIGGNLYFDFARRYVRSGDITIRRKFVPFMGLGVGFGMYKFEGAGGESGAMIAPRAMLGFNVMLTDLIGIDLTYQYQLMAGDGFGWNASNGANGVSDVIVSFRVNF